MTLPVQVRRAAQPTERETIDDVKEKMRKNPTLRSGKDFKLAKDDLDPNTGTWRLIVTLRTFGVVSAISLLLVGIAFLVSLLAFPDATYQPILLICGGSLWLVVVLLITSAYANSAYVLKPNAKWGISQMGRLIKVVGPGGRIQLVPFFQSVFGVGTIRARTINVPVNRGVMRGAKGKRTVPVGLNVVIAYAIGETEAEWFKALLAVEELDGSVVEISEELAVSWMREHSLLDLIEGPSEISATEEGSKKPPGQEMKEILERNLQDWGVKVVKPVGMTDIDLPAKISESFQQAESADQLLLSINRSIREKFSGREEEWYAEATLRVLAILQFGGGGGQLETLNLTDLLRGGALGAKSGDFPG